MSDDNFLEFGLRGRLPCGTKQPNRAKERRQEIQDAILQKYAPYINALLDRMLHMAYCDPDPQVRLKAMNMFCERVMGRIPQAPTDPSKGLGEGGSILDVLAHVSQQAAQLETATPHRIEHTSQEDAPPIHAPVEPVRHAEGPQDAAFVELLKELDEGSES